MSNPWELGRRSESQHQTARELRAVMTRALEIAAERGAANTEAEHLLLAVTEHPESRGGAFLAANGLDHTTLEAALRGEREHALGSVGAPAYREADLAATPRRRKPRWGTSARETWERGFRVARGGREHVSTLNLVVGALSAELGTVPRALSIAGVDRHKLLGQALVEATKGLTR